MSKVELRNIRASLERLVSGSKGRRRRRAAEIVEECDLFDRGWYLDFYKDVASTGADPLLHYLEHGWLEGRDPGPRFSTIAYLRANQDVAKAGVNPLLHYIQFGEAEGRGTAEHGARSQSRQLPRKTFGPAAPCASFELERGVARKWRRASDGRAARGDFVLDGYFICACGDARTKAQLAQALARLAALSGAKTAAVKQPKLNSDFALIDCWYSGGRLRSRWKSSRKVVVRVLQQVGNMPKLIGEALVVDELDSVEALLDNPHFPLLFLFTTAKGVLLGCRFIAFPSLCRGGVHYPEMLAIAAPEGPCEPLRVEATMQRLEGQLYDLRTGTQPLVSKIEVDVTRADGTEPIFSSEFQHFLIQIFSVPMCASSGASGRAQEYLASAVRVRPEAPRSGSATLTIAGDMAPSMSLLVAAAEHDESAIRTPLVVASSDPAQPAIYISAPTSSTVEPSPSNATFFPMLRPNTKAGGASLGVPVAAVRMARRAPLTDAEMLMPFAPAVKGPPATEAVTWLLISAQERGQDTLACIEALAVQAAASHSKIIFIGKSSPAAELHARRLFKGRVRHVADFARAVRSLDTPLAAFLDAAVVLHDTRTAGVLLSALSRCDAATASAVLVSAGPRGQEGVISPVDFGELLPRASCGYAARSDLRAVAAVLWRAEWLCTAPPAFLWVARSQTLKSWVQSQPAETDAPHVCTFAVTASLTSAPAPSDACFSVPQSLHGVLICRELL